jgi:hypothetical protein
MDGHTNNANGHPSDMVHYTKRFYLPHPVNSSETSQIIYLHATHPQLEDYTHKRRYILVQI